MTKPTVEALAEEMKKLTELVDTIKAERAEDAARRMELYAGEHAMREALLQFTQEIAVREGFPVELFVRRFEAAIDWHRDRFLGMVEGVDPQLAAQIDQRHFQEIPTDVQPPAILPG